MFRCFVALLLLNPFSAWSNTTNLNLLEPCPIITGRIANQKRLTPTQIEGIRKGILQRLQMIDPKIVRFDYIHNGDSSRGTIHGKVLRGKTFRLRLWKGENRIDPREQLVYLVYGLQSDGETLMFHQTIHDPRLKGIGLGTYQLHLAISAFPQTIKIATRLGAENFDGFIKGMLGLEKSQSLPKDRKELRDLLQNAVRICRSRRECGSLRQRILKGIAATPAVKQRARLGFAQLSRIYLFEKRMGSESGLNVEADIRKGSSLAHKQIRIFLGRLVENTHKRRAFEISPNGSLIEVDESLAIIEEAS